MRILQLQSLFCSFIYFIIAVDAFACIQSNCTTAPGINIVPPSTKGPYILRIGLLETDETSRNISLKIQNKNTQKSVVETVLELADEFEVSVAIFSVPETRTGIASQLFAAYDVLALSTSSISSAYTLKLRKYYSLVRNLPSEDVESKAILQLLKDYNISYVAYVFDTYSMGYESLYTFSELADRQGISVVPVYISDPGTEELKLVRAIIYSVANVDLADNFEIVAKNKGIIGDSYLYIFTSKAYPTATARKYEFAKGALAIDFGVNNSEYASSIERDWTLADQTIFPGSRTPDSWAYFDTVNTFVHAVESLRQKKSQWDRISTQDVLYLVPSLNVPSMSGACVFDSNQDRLGVFSFYNIAWDIESSEEFPLIATMDWSHNTTVPFINYLPSPISYYGGSTINPAFVVRMWEICNYEICFHKSIGCTPEGVCICEPQYEGQFCEDIVDIEQGRSITKIIVVSVVPAVSALLFLAAIGYWRYRHKKVFIMKFISARHDTEFLPNEFQIVERIGSGSSGEVLYADLTSGHKVAVKHVCITQASAGVVEDFHQETAILCRLQHPNVIKFVGSCFDVSNREFFMITELMPKGSLRNALYNQQVKIPMVMKVHICWQVAQGILYLHSLSPPIVHCDLKCDNILLDSNWNAKISDIGINRFKGMTHKVQQQPTKIGTLLYTPPEILVDNSDYDEKSDCYSFGLLLWEVFHRQEVFDNTHTSAVVYDVIYKSHRPTIASSVPPVLKDLITSCWDQEPAKRPKFAEICLSLRQLSLDNPIPSSETSSLWYHTPPPLSTAYFVNTEMESVNYFWSCVPRAFQRAIALHNELLRTLAELHHGYEAQFQLDKCGFMFVFPELSHAINFCVAVQLSLLKVVWPDDILKCPPGAAVAVGEGPKATTIWRGPRVRMSVHYGAGTAKDSVSSHRLKYSGLDVKTAQSLLSLRKGGSIIVSATVANEITNSKTSLFLESIVLEQLGSNANATYGIRQVMPRVLLQRTNPMNDDVEIPMSLLGVQEDGIDAKGIEMQEFLPWTSQFEEFHETLFNEWVIKWKELKIHSLLERGTISDFYRAKLRDQEVVVKLLLNQHMKEQEIIRLVADAVQIRNLDHPNLLHLVAMCIEPGHICFVYENMAKGNLPKLLSEDLIPLSFLRRLEIAREIAKGMEYLSQLPDPVIRLHDRFSSNNVLISSQWEVKIAAPEVIKGQELTIRSPVYSYGIILWELFTGKIPYAGEHPLKILPSILNGYRPRIPEDCPRRYRNLMQSCWDIEPENRPTWSVILRDLDHILAEFREPTTI